MKSKRVNFTLSEKAIEELKVLSKKWFNGRENLSMTIELLVSQRITLEQLDNEIAQQEDSDANASA